MNRRMRLAIAVASAVLSVGAGRARPARSAPATRTGPAQSAPAPPPDGEVAAADGAAPDVEPDDGLADPEATTLELRDRIDELEARLSAAEQSRASRFPVKLTGYGDIGLFVTQGDGSGVRRDVGHALFPRYRDIGWVFYGDLLATQVNSRGDVADLGELPGVDRFDSVNSEGNLTFLANELNLTINAGLGASALFTSSVNFTPRTGTDFRLGDSFDVDLLQLEWLPTSDGNTSIFVGKVDSVIGVEYKRRKAVDRFGITPSLLARYTTGTAVGLKVRSKLFAEHAVVAAALTNGSFGTEQFHFFDEVDTNTFKTLSGRAALRLPFAGGGFEMGPSGQWGTQDGAPDGAGKMWLVGVDAELETPRLHVTAEWLRAKAPGDDFSMTYSLDLKNAAYLEADVIVTPILGVLGRVDFRDALVQQGTDRLYITRVWRATGGVRFVLNPRAVVKAEYIHIREYGGTPSIPDDVVTTSAVMAF